MPPLPSMSSLLAQMLNAKERLPQNLKTLFEMLYVQGLSDEQVRERLKLPPEVFARDKSCMLRSLKAVAS